MNALTYFIGIIYLMLPGILANSLPVIVKRIPFLCSPLDGGHSFRGKPVFGPNKTWRGLVVGVSGAVIIAVLQQWLYHFEVFQSISFIDYSLVAAPLLGFLMGFGALLGDMIESFFKRQHNIGSGESWFPWDQLDAVIGGLVLVLPVYPLPLIAVIIVFPLAIILHVATRHIAYWLGINKEKW